MNEKDVPYFRKCFWLHHLCHHPICYFLHPPGRLWEWKRHLLSQGGKRALLRRGADLLPNYHPPTAGKWSPNVILPISQPPISERIFKICLDCIFSFFFWRSNAICDLIKWVNLCFPQRAVRLWHSATWRSLDATTTAGLQEKICCIPSTRWVFTSWSPCQPEGWLSFGTNTPVSPWSCSRNGG